MQKLDARLSMRLSVEDKDNFINTCYANELQPNDVIRKLIRAYAESRLKITPIKRIK